MSRQRRSLNGKWKYVLDPYETGQVGFLPVHKNLKPKDRSDRVEYSFDDAQSLWVPGSWNFQKPELTYYEGCIWYRKTFQMDAPSKDERFFVYVGAANYHSTVTVNGEVLGTHEGGFTPFSFEVTAHLRQGENFVIIGVSNSRAADQVPAKVTDWFNHGGITRDVELVAVPRAFIKQHTLSLDASTLDQERKRIVGTVKLDGESFPASLRLIIADLGIDRQFPVDANGDCSIQLDTEGLELWSPEHPRLYEVSIHAGGDSVEDSIGFRTIAVSGTQVLLNGRPIFLRGISLHDENPLRRDRASTLEDAELVLGWVKELGCNFARLAHYPHQENIVRLADRLGLLLWEELPLYWGIDWENPKVLDSAKRQYTEVIQRDRNRASVILWSIANETIPSEARNEFLRAIANHVRSLDGTRLLTAAGKKDQAVDGHPDNDYTINDPIMDLLDVVSFNEYLGWYGGAPSECRKKTFRAIRKMPIIVSEFGGDALQGFHGDEATRWSEEYQANLYRENLAMFDRIEGLAGLTPWILMDFLTPLRQLPNIQDGWNRKGVISERGIKKQAFYELKRYYEGK